MAIKSIVCFKRIELLSKAPPGDRFVISRVLDYSLSSDVALCLRYTRQRRGTLPDSKVASMSASDGVEGSSTGTWVPWKWGLFGAPLRPLTGTGSAEGSGVRVPLFVPWPQFRRDH